MDKNEIIFFHNDTGNILRNGLTIFSLPKKIGYKTNKSRMGHLSLQQNFFFRILKRGMPKLYEYNINQKYKKLSCIAFDEVLMKNLKIYMKMRKYQELI